MTVIWGLDLKEMQWWKFKSSYMFHNTDYHMRRTKFVIYQAAMILCVVSESLGTAVLSDYLDQQDKIQRLFPGVYVFNNDFVGIASYNIFIGVAVATVFGAAFFFDLFWPERYEPRNIQWAWQGSAVFLCFACLADALAYTTILALRGEKVSNLDGMTAEQVALLQLEFGRTSNKTPIPYRHSGRAVASVVLLWLGWAATVASTVVMILFYKHVRRYGSAKSPHAIDTFVKSEPKDVEEKTIVPEANSNNLVDAGAEHTAEKSNTLNTTANHPVQPEAEDVGPTGTGTSAITHDLVTTEAEHTEERKTIPDTNV